MCPPYERRASIHFIFLVCESWLERARFIERLAEPKQTGGLRISHAEGCDRPARPRAPCLGRQARGACLSSFFLSRSGGGGNFGETGEGGGGDFGGTQRGPGEGGGSGSPGPPSTFHSPSPEREDPPTSPPPGGGGVVEGRKEVLQRSLLFIRQEGYHLSPTFCGFHIVLIDALCKAVLYGTYNHSEKVK